MDRGLWPGTTDPVRVPTLRVYAEMWLAARDLKPSTRAHYRTLLDQHLLPSLGGLPLEKINPATVRAWYVTTDSTKPTQLNFARRFAVGRPEPVFWTGSPGAAEPCARLHAWKAASFSSTSRTVGGTMAQ